MIKCNKCKKDLPKSATYTTIGGQIIYKWSYCLDCNYWTLNKEYNGRPSEYNEFQSDTSGT